jgi:hypothetical protein
MDPPTSLALQTRHLLALVTPQDKQNNSVYIRIYQAVPSRFLRSSPAATLPTGKARLQWSFSTNLLIPKLMNHDLTLTTRTPLPSQHLHLSFGRKSFDRTPASEDDDPGPICEFRIDSQY